MREVRPVHGDGILVLLLLDEEDAFVEEGLLVGSVHHQHLVQERDGSCYVPLISESNGLVHLGVEAVRGDCECRGVRRDGIVILARDGVVVAREDVVEEELVHVHEGVLNDCVPDVGRIGLGGAAAEAMPMVGIQRPIVNTKLETTSPWRMFYLSVKVTTAKEDVAIDF